MRPTCYNCLRPEVACVCKIVQRVVNATQILVLQHPRERLHPLGTARLLRMSLSNITVSPWGYPHPDPEWLLHPPAGAAILFPHPEATNIADLTPENRPTTVIALDGTWPHAKGMYKALPSLQALPHIAITPREPSRYRIRREPKHDCLSTLEAIAQTLQILEPHNAELPRLTQIFDNMIDLHLKLRRERPQRPYFHKRKQARMARAQAQTTATATGHPPT